MCQKHNIHTNKSNGPKQKHLFRFNKLKWHRSSRWTLFNQTHTRNSLLTQKRFTRENGFGYISLSLTFRWIALFFIGFNWLNFRMRCKIKYINFQIDLVKMWSIARAAAAVASEIGLNKTQFSNGSQHRNKLETFHVCIFIMRQDNEQVYTMVTVCRCGWHTVSLSHSCLLSFFM